MRSSPHIVVLVTAGSREEAQKIAQGLLDEKLAACVNILTGVESHFWWQGKIDTAGELVLVIKTRRSLFSKLAKKVKSLHSYRVPEIIGLPIICGNSDYLNWINDSTR